MTANRIVLELHSLNNLIRRFFEFSSQKKEIDSATGNNAWIIGYLAEHQHQDIYQKDIEDHFTITRSTVSKVLSLMEQKGLIQRQDVARDARLKKIVLTEAALKLREDMLKDVMALERKLLKGFEAEEIEELRSYLRRMKENISGSCEKKGGNLCD